MKASTELRSIELFTGAGGLALGTHKAGFRHNALVEWDADSCDTLRSNIQAHALPGVEHWQVIQGDVRQVSLSEFGPVDLVAGGPPCQPFSIGGKHQGRVDTRDMIPQLIRGVRELEPRAFILENVKGLTREAFRSYFEYIRLQLAYPGVTKKPRETWMRHLGRLEDIHTKGGFPDLHYKVVARVLNAANYGVPQTRERVFVVGMRADLNIDWHFPEETHSERSLYDAKWTTGEYWSRHGLKRPRVLPPEEARGKPREPQLGPVLAPWRTLRDAIADLPAPKSDEAASGVTNHRLQTGARVYVGHTGSPLDLPSKTLKAGVHGVPGGENMIRYPDGKVRYLTVREAARVQTFPDEWRFFGAWSENMRQLGNAVPMRLAEVVASSVATRLRSIDG